MLNRLAVRLQGFVLVVAFCLAVCAQVVTSECTDAELQEKASPGGSTRLSKLLEEGTAIELVQDHLGHSDIRNTMIYARVTDKRRTALAKLLNEKRGVSNKPATKSSTLWASKISRCRSAGICAIHAAAYASLCSGASYSHQDRGGRGSRIRLRSC